MRLFGLVNFISSGSFGASWAVFGGALERLGGGFGGSWGVLKASWERLGGVLGRPGGVLGTSWGGVLEASWAS